MIKYVSADDVKGLYNIILMKINDNKIISLEFKHIKFNNIIMHFTFTSHQSKIYQNRSDSGT